MGPALFKHHPMVYAAMACWRWGLAWFLYRSRAGLVLRAVGESPESAHALGYPVRGIRLAAVVAGGRTVRAGGRLPLGDLHTAVGRGHGGRSSGWIALALTTFATWRPARILAGRLPLRRGDDAAIPPARARACRSPSQWLSDAALPQPPSWCWC